jgi:hypothetical protein
MEVVKCIAQRIDLGREIVKEHELAKRALIDAGRPRELVDRMPHIQVAILYALLVHERHLDNLVKYDSFGYWQARPLFDEAMKQIAREKTSAADALAVRLEGLFGPRADRVIASRARLERRIAALCAVESVRAYAAVHGKPPAALADIRAFPVPVDPVFGKEFQYQVAGEQIMVASPAQQGLPSGLAPGLSYELRLIQPAAREPATPAKEGALPR